MLAQHALVINTSPVSGLSISQQKGDPQALFSQILNQDLISADSPELAETLATLNPPQSELSDEALRQLVADLRQLFSAPEMATPETVSSETATPQMVASETIIPTVGNLDLDVSDESSESIEFPPPVALNTVADSATATSKNAATMENRQSIMPGGNGLPPSQDKRPEALLKTLDGLSPEQFDQVMAQLPGMAVSLKKNLTADGHPILLNVTLKNVTVINGQLVSGNSLPVNTKTGNVLATAGEEGDITPENKRGEPLATVLKNGHSTTVNATQYRAQMLQNSRSMAEGKTNSDGEISSSTLLDTGQGSKSQQHDRLMATLFSMRQELSAERQPLDVRQRALLSEQLNSATALSDSESDALNGLISLSTPSTGGQATVTSAVNLPLQHPRWGTAVSEKVVWMMNAQIKEASIKLNPASLGSIEIKLSLVDDQANVTFNVLTSQAKEALESALPRLREMLAEQGIALNDTSVSDQSEYQDDNSQPLLADSAHQQDDSSDHHDDAALQSVMTVNAQTGVDIYI